MSDAITVRSSIEIRGIGEVFRLAEALSRCSGFVPKDLVGRSDAIAAVILTGLELGLGPMESLREVVMIKGRPTLSAGLMLARALRAGLTVEWLESSDTCARLRLTRGDVSYEQTWTIEMARTAGLVGRDGPWRTYPEAMLRARAASAAVRAFAPDVIGGGGLYTPEEAADIPEAEPRRRVEARAALPEDTPPEPGEAPRDASNWSDETTEEPFEVQRMRAYIRQGAANLRDRSPEEKRAALEQWVAGAAKVGLTRDDVLAEVRQ